MLMVRLKMQCQTQNKISFEGEKDTCRYCGHENWECYECADYKVGL